MRFEFDFDYPLAAPLAAFGILPATSFVDVADGELVARFGPWSLRTPVSNIASTEVSGPYRWYTAVGVRMSIADRGITFGSNAKAGLCLQFDEPVKALIPGGHGPRNPNATLTVTDPLLLQREIIRASA
jgi:hypothetical protein